MQNPSLKTQNELLKLQNPQTIERQLKSNKLITNTSIAIFNCIDNNDFSDLDRDVFNTFKISTLKSISIMNSANNFDYECDYAKLTMTDPFSTWSLVRAQFESFCNFNNIMIQQNSEEEKELKYLVWKMSGLKNRQTYSATTQENIEKKETERLEIENIKSQITLNSFFNLLTTKSQDVLRNVDKNNWKVVINSDSAKKVGWQELFERSGVNFSGLSKFYTYLSTCTHPTYLSSIQFVDIYNISNDDDKITRFALEFSNIIMSFFIIDLCNYSKKIKNYFDTLPESNRTLINMNNMFRTSNY